MQYANVIINHKAGFKALTYAIPASLLPHLEQGSVVLVPFGKLTVHGVVDRFIRRVSPEVAPKLKPIKSVVYSGHAVDPAKLDAMHWLNREWGLSLGQTLFRLLPDLPKRLQQNVTPIQTAFSRYEVIEYQIGLLDREKWYFRVFKKLRKNHQSALIIAPTHLEAQTLSNKLTKLGCNCALYPELATVKTRREYWLKSQITPTPTLYIGTRGVLVCDFRTLGAVIVVEPWLPGHKDDSSPKLWSVFNANALVRAKKIPLLLVSSLLWPENHLLPIKKTHRQPPQLGTIRLTPKRSLEEQITHWLAETEGLDRRIVVHQTSHEIIWCSHCQKTSNDAQTCPACGSVPVILPRISVEEVEAVVTDKTIVVIPVEESGASKPTSATLAVNFDAYLSITDWRASLYLGTITRHFQEMSQQTHLATAHPDTWTRLIDKLEHDFEARELEARRTVNLPPSSILVRLSANQSDVLTKLLPIELDNLIQVGKVHRSAEQYAITILLKPNSKLPDAWTRSSLFKLDILPLYLHW